MTAKQYADELYPNERTYNKIAEMAFEKGLMIGLAQNEKLKVTTRLKCQVQDLKKELKDLKQMIYDPERLSDYIMGG